MPVRRAFLTGCRPQLSVAVANCIIFLVICPGVGAQNGAPGKPHLHESRKDVTKPSRVSFSPRFVPGQTLLYEMESETTTATTRSGLASDPQGPSNLVVDWNATVRIDVLPVDAGTPGATRLRTTYEKSAATVHSDTFDPAAAETQEQYQKLEGKVLEFVLDAGGKVQSVSGLEGMVEGEKATQSAREWIAQLGASAGAPAAGVTVGQTWSSQQPANSLPVAGMVWRADSQYLRNEPCHPPNPDLPAAAGSAENPQTTETCAVILASLSLFRPKAVHDPTPPEFRKNGVQTTGQWNGSAESLLYVSLSSGFLVSATQTGTEELDVTLTNSRGASMRYAGTISSRSHVALASGEPKGE